MPNSTRCMPNALCRYGLHGAADQPFDALSGDQQARLQVLLLELDDSTLLLLDEPTGILDLVSAEALHSGLERYEGTVLSVTGYGQIWNEIRRL